jgi:hypothetical protein
MRSFLRFSSKTNRQCLRDHTGFYALSGHLFGFRAPFVGERLNKKLEHVSDIQTSYRHYICNIERDLNFGL